MTDYLLVLRGYWPFLAFCYVKANSGNVIY